MKKDTGVYQLENGYWAFRLTTTIGDRKVNYRRTKDLAGNKLKNKTCAIKAREALLIHLNSPTPKKYTKITFGEVFNEYREKGRSGKAYTTLLKQDSLWRNHIEKKFSKRYVDEITVAEINDYLAELYYVEGRAFGYVEAFIKIFYLVFGQAYSRNYLDVDTYNKLCVNKDTKIRMPKRKVNDDDEIVSFSKEELAIMDEYFKTTTLETAYLLGKYCGLRINECFGLKWDNVNLEEGFIQISWQMQYQNSVIRLVALKSRNANRIIYLAKPLQEYLIELRKTIDAAEIDLAAVRKQQQMLIEDSDGNIISSLELVNTLPNGKMRTVNSMKRHTKRLRDEYGICFKYHYLRHTYGTMLAEMNTPSHILCKQMGHANSKTTEKYYLAISKRGVDILLDNLNTL